MKLHEYQSKAILARYGISSPFGKVVTTPEEARMVADSVSTPMILKAQNFAASRSLSGGFLRVDTPTEAYIETEKLLGSKIGGYEVKQVLLEEYVTIASEGYIAITTDYTIGKPVIVASNQSGVEIHKATASNSNDVFYEVIEPLIGLRDYQIRRLAGNLFIELGQWSEFQAFASGLYRCYVESDATLAEINPLATISDSGQLLALDAKLYIDDNALYRQPELAKMHDIEGEIEGEVYLHEAGVIYHHLDGQIGCMVNGAGLAMTIMDLIREADNGEYSPANFLDLGGSARTESISNGLKTIISNPSVQVVLVNIFAGLIRCDEVAEGIIKLLEEEQSDLPFVIRLQGTRAEVAHDILAQSGHSNIIHAFSLTDAVTEAVEHVQLD